MPSTQHASISLALAALTALALAGCGNKKTPATPAAPAKAAKAASAVFGAGKPKVDIVAFVGFECPHSRASAAGLMKVVEAHKDTVRLRVVNLPLEVHKASVPLARGFVAAAKQGQWRAFWDHFYGLKKPTAGEVFTWAGGAKLDMAKFKADLAQADDDVALDAGLAEVLGVAGTPSYLVNGALLQGAQSEAAWQKIIAGQVAMADAKLKSGVKQADLMRVLAETNSPKRAPFYVKHVLRGAPAPKAKIPVPVKRKSGVVAAKLMPAAGGGGAAVQLGGQPAGGAAPQDTIWRVIVRPDDPVIGPAHAPLTAVVFSDYECRHSKALQPTLAKLRKTYGKDLRIVYKHNPLPFHKHALHAAEAAEAARAQGKFAAMHAALFNAAPALEPQSVSAAAANAKLDTGAFQNAMSAHGARARIQQDIEQAAAVGARGTPNIFVNGRKVVGAKSFEELKPVFEMQLAAARKLVADGTPLPALYEKLVGEGRLLSSLASKPVQIDTAGAATRGPKGAAIHIVTFQDFQCPFCGRLDPHIAAMEKEFDGRVKVTWLDFPLSKIHPNAQLAAEAGKEALAQGKFWQFHAAAMADQGKLDQAGLIALGKKVGMDTKKLTQALATHSWAAQVAKDAGQAQKLGLKGTPSVFINGYAFTPQLGFSANTFRSAIRRLLGTR